MHVHDIKHHNISDSEASPYHKSTLSELFHHPSNVDEMGSAVTFTRRGGVAVSVPVLGFRSIAQFILVYQGKIFAFDGFNCIDYSINVCFICERGAVKVVFAGKVTHNCVRLHNVDIFIRKARALAAWIQIAIGLHHLIVDAGLLIVDFQGREGEANGFSAACSEAWENLETHKNFGQISKLGILQDI